MNNQTCINCGKVINSSSKICNYCGTAQDKYNNQFVEEVNSDVPVATMTQTSPSNSRSVPVAVAVSATQPPVVLAAPAVQQTNTVPLAAIGVPNDIPAAVEPPNNYMNVNAIGASTPYATYDVAKAGHNAELIAMGQDSDSPNSTSVGLAFLHAPADSLKGSFEVPYKIKRFGILSRSTLDFSTARFVNKITKIRGGKLLGKIHIIIPRGVEVQVYGPLTKSATDSMKYGEYNLNMPHPIIQVKGIELLGGIKVDINRTVAPIQLIGM